MKRSMRKTTPKVVDGKVRRKNRWRPSTSYLGDRRVSIERRRPGYDYRHVVTQDEVYSFLQIVPDWDQLARRLDKIILDEGSEYRSGWFARGKIAICAFPRDMAVGFDKTFFYRDIDFFDRLNVPYRFADESEEDEPNHEVTCIFNRATARCYVLMRTLLHELGHHVDLITNRKRRCSRGEDFAEEFGRKLEQQMWGDYVRVFRNPK